VVTGGSNGRAGGAAPSVLSRRPPLVGGRGEAFAVGGELRRIGPMTTASGAYCIVEPWPSSGRGTGRSVCSCRRAWRGRGVGRGGGFIQVGMRGYASRVGGLFSPFGEAVLLRPEEYSSWGGEKRENSVAIQAPSLGRREWPPRE
jgi:hypothetical protein